MKIWIVLSLAAAMSCSVVASQGGFGFTSQETTAPLSSR